jgi:hypothetical protein
MSFPKKGKSFPPGSVHHAASSPVGSFVDEIASALQRSRREGGASVKQVAYWTGANEKTVKNWFAGECGPSGAHLVALARHSDEVLGVFLAMAGRERLMVAFKLVAAEAAIVELLAAVRRLADEAH